MKNISEIQYNPNTQAAINDDREQAVPEDIKILVQYIFKSFKGMYNFTGIKDQNDLKLKQQEMTRALFDNRFDITQSSVADSLKWLRTSGDKWMPTVPEFIQLCLGNHPSQRKPPEHVWFKPALPERTAQDQADLNKSKIADLRKALKGSK